MNYLKYLWCTFIVGHDWRRDNDYPVHGWRDTPYPDSYCGRCGMGGPLA